MQASKNIYHHKYRSFFYIGLVCYTSFLVISAILYKERIIQPDNSAYLFEILNSSDFVIAQVRRIAIFPQMPSVIATKIGMSLRNVGILFSVGYSLYYFAIYVLLGTVLKKYKFALVLLLFNILIVSHTFYWCVSELPLGIAALILLVAIYENRSFKEISLYEHPILLVSLFIIISSHPLMIFTIFFIVFYLYRTNKFRKSILTYFFFVSIVSFIIYRVRYGDIYENDRINSIQNIITLFPYYINLQSNKQLIHDFNNYIPAMFIWITAIFYYLKKKRIFDLIWINGFLLLYLFIVNVSFFAYSVSYYFENMYNVIAIALCFVFVFEIFPKINKNTIQSSVILILYVLCIIRIFNYKEIYQLRLDWYRHYIEKQTYRNVVLPESIAPIDTLIAPWSTAFDVPIISSLEMGKTYSILFLSDLDSMPNPKPVFEGKVLTGLREIPYNKISKRYFNFEKSPYHVQYNLYE